MTKKKPYLNAIIKILLLFFLVLLLNVAITYYAHLFDKCGLIQKEILANNPLINIITTPILLWLSTYLCRKYYPDASGHKLQNGVNILKNNVNDYTNASKYLNLKMVFFKAIPSLISALGGGSLGKEGPSVHIGAAIMATFGNKFKNLYSEISILAWTIIGAATGLLFVFQCPISALVFGSEKLIKASFAEFKKAFVILTLIVIACAIFFCKNEAIFPIKNVYYQYEKNTLITIISLIFVCSLLSGIIKNFGLFLFSRLFENKSKNWNIIIISVSLVIAILNYYGGIYSYGGGLHTLSYIIEYGHNPTYKEVLIRISNTMLTFAIGSVGGIIAPALAIGAAIGNIFQQFFLNFDNIFLIIGMASFLSIALGEAFAAAFLIFEITGQKIIILPILIFSSYVSYKINNIVLYFIPKISDK